MSDQTISSLVLKASLDASEFVKGAGATEEAQQKIIDQAEKAGAATDKMADKIGVATKKVTAHWKTQQESINELNDLLQNGEREEEKRSGKRSSNAQKEANEERAINRERRAESRDQRAELTAERQERDEVRRADKQAADEARKQELHDQKTKLTAIREQDREEDRAHREQGVRLNNARNLFASVASSALGVFGLVTGVRAIGSAYTNLTGDDAAEGRAARNFGVSAHGLDAFGNAVGLSGGNPNDGMNTIGNLANLRQNLKLTGTDARLPALQALGVSPADANGKFKDPQQMLDELHRSVQGMDRDRALGLLTAAGIDGGTQNLLLESNADYSRDRSQGDRNSNVTDQTAAAAQARQRAGVNKSQTEREAFRAAVDTFGGWVIKFDDAMSKLASFGADHPILTGAVAAAGAGLGVAKAIGGGWLTAKAFGALAGKVPGVTMEAVEAAEARIPTALLSAAEAGGSFNPYLLALSAALYPSSTAGPEGDEVYPRGVGAPGSKSAAFNGAVGSLMKMGWSREAASGLAANIEAESGFDPSIHQKGGGGGVGLAQWTDPVRKARIARYLGKPIDQASTEEQLGAINWEVRNFYKGSFAAAQASGDAGKAGGIFSRGYESPKAADYQAHMRASLANQRYSAASANTVHVDTINVHTQAKDANGIAKDIHASLQQNMMAAYANHGLA